MIGGRQSRGRSAVAVLGVALIVPLSVRAQAAEGPEISFTGRVHAQWNTSSAEGAIDSEFVLRRARISARVQVNDLVSGKIQPEFVGEGARLRDAYVELDFSPYFQMTMGQFKRPFDLFELESSTRSLTIERTGKIREVGSCAGVGGICSYSRLTEKLQYSARDIGVRFAGALGGSPLSYALAVTNGEGAGTSDRDSEKSFSARLEYEALENLSISANLGVHDYVNTVDPTDRYGSAFGVDVDWGDYGPGTHVQWSFIEGDNWKDLDAGGAPSTFRATQAVVSYRFPLESSSNLTGLEPVFRLSWADPDTSTSSDSEYFSTAGVILHFLGRNRLAANLEMWDPTVGDREYSVKVQTYLHF